MGRVSVVGLGKLGACMAAAIASRGHDVIGVDVSAKTVATMSEGRAPVLEPDLEAMIATNHSRLRATQDFASAIADTDVTFVVVPTPSDDRGAFSLRYASEAFASIGRALAVKDGYHLVVLTSTVLPGSTRYGLLPVLESTSGKRVGRDIGVCYSPEFIALGSVIRDFLNPDFLLIGESDERAGTQLETFMSTVVLNDAPVRRMSIENAELAKIALNSFVTTKISFANMLADLCERIPGGSVDVVTAAIGLDRRIGVRFLKGGLGFGGPCFPRDNRALAFIAEALGTSADLPAATDRANKRVVPRLIERLRDVGALSGTAAILGLAYKPGSNVVEESQALMIADALSKEGMRVIAFDPLAIHERFSATMEECLAADVVVLATPDTTFDALRSGTRFRPGTTVVDCWRLLDADAVRHSGVRYLSIGDGTEDNDDAASLKALWEL